MFYSNPFKRIIEQLKRLFGRLDTFQPTERVPVCRSFTISVTTLGCRTELKSETFYKKELFVMCFLFLLRLLKIVVYTILKKVSDLYLMSLEKKKGRLKITTLQTLPSDGFSITNLFPTMLE